MAFLFAPDLAKDGVTVKWSSFVAGPPENESFAAGQQDAGFMGDRRDRQTDGRLPEENGTRFDSLAGAVSGKLSDYGLRSPASRRSRAQRLSRSFSIVATSAFPRCAKRFCVAR